MLSNFRLALKVYVHKLTVKLSTVEPTNSIDLYVAPETDISPIIYNEGTIECFSHQYTKLRSITI